MIIIPAIDLINGKCVRLYQGDFNQSSQVGSDPLSQLQEFIRDGAKLVHIVDLEGARQGKSTQFDLIRQLCQASSVPIQIGGGIRTVETIKQYVDAGASRIVLGTGALEDATFLKKALTLYPDHIVIGIDAKNGKVATRGWETVSEIDYLDFAKQMESYGVQRIVFTDISKDGTMTGPNVDALETLLHTVTCTIVASGGIKDMGDINKLKEIGIQEAIVGKAIYEGKVTLEEE
ncbi:1-(5-phosphoribosyl)-5-[(5-phosphoribosylamino)methylideneamino]imidazole-4-carboxamide isomerase [Aquibacillus sp. 3ASR75-11]|uniref:1-(5-phosphoribosyl)-5-[(5-phosphoribosylamino)methylideneamino] imidazole-4-carboxamide isomerase n=1 Tax=Terrihalobacillus insolitus TaxID=2950438 RepID=A0A9X3WWR7_9BACI|nr:1-(5-phosphoribosyl)-5-[(5-phosphoribosylamino)methylideneamino]imidazole-4-carboxamide isomerase [Terrihalobacillus insolitus]MDC3415187.1 1-(5-phosphoribosyl)-5-[(5-phosphoribosylamino)methylideneamino]imidazole-4-carboxamide isomerase [Terrihalobacillus insolitus]MDC3426208.1 1-(5-phosphoribosyl)-5-[(5-phosphoribosylamino)methylideneamino]imidazole-4-carboxamide isomerase [Terrihalobacillus insolitus]